MPRGSLRKMSTSGGNPIGYRLSVGEAMVPMNELLGRTVAMRWSGEIECVHCGRRTKKSFQQGYCYPCFSTLARCDSCMVRPELCHYHAGTCREAEWGEKHCLVPHIVYLANSSGLKVGVTRGLDPFHRWADQGAAQGLAIRITESRLEAGRIEVALKQFVADRTNWRAMLKGVPEPLDLAAARERLLGEAVAMHGEVPGRDPEAAEVMHLEYPVLEYPEKVVSRDLTKEPSLEGTLLGIKGQYLILDCAVFNVRKHAGFVVEVS